MAIRARRGCMGSVAYLRHYSCCHLSGCSSAFLRRKGELQCPEIVHVPTINPEFLVKATSKEGLEILRWYTHCARYATGDTRTSIYNA